MQNRIDAIVKITLINSNGMALSTLQTLCNLWNLRMLGCETNSNIATITIPYITFKNIFKMNPTNKLLNIPNTWKSFILELEVVGTEIVEINNNASCQTEKEIGSVGKS